MPLTIDNIEYNTISGYISALIASKNQLAQNLEQTGSWLKSNYSTMISNSNTSLSGYLTGNYPQTTSISGGLNNTGSILDNKINTLSGYVQNLVPTLSNLPWTGTNININLGGSFYQSINLSGNSTFTFSNVNYGQNVNVKIARQTGALVTMNFPNGVTWLGSGAKPPSLATSKTGILNLMSWSDSNNGIIAQWIAQK